MRIVKKYIQELIDKKLLDDEGFLIYANSHPTYEKNSVLIGKCILNGSLKVACEGWALTPEAKEVFITLRLAMVHDVSILRIHSQEKLKRYRALYPRDLRKDSEILDLIEEIKVHQNRYEEYWIFRQVHEGPWRLHNLYLGHP